MIDRAAIAEELLADLTEVDHGVERRFESMGLARDPELIELAPKLVAMDSPAHQRVGAKLMAGQVRGPKPAVQQAPANAARIASLKSFSVNERIGLLQAFGCAGHEILTAKAWIDALAHDEQSEALKLCLAAREGDFEFIKKTAGPQVAPFVIRVAVRWHAQDDSFIAWLKGLDPTVRFAAEVHFEAHVARGDVKSAARLLCVYAPTSSHIVKKHASSECLGAIEALRDEFPETVASILTALSTWKDIRPFVSTQVLRELCDHPAAGTTALVGLATLCRYSDEAMGLPMARLLDAIDGAKAPLQETLLSTIALDRTPMSTEDMKRLVAWSGAKQAGVRAMAAWAACAHASDLDDETLKSTLAMAGDKSAAVRAQFALCLPKLIAAGHDLTPIRVTLESWVARSPKKAKSDNARFVGIGGAIGLGAIGEASPAVRVWWRAGLDDDNTDLADACSKHMGALAAKDPVYRAELAGDARIPKTQEAARDEILAQLVAVVHGA